MSTLSIWDHWRQRADAKRRRSTAQRELQRKATTIRRQTRHERRDVRRKTTTTLAVARSRITELALQAVDRGDRTGTSNNQIGAAESSNHSDLSA
jgi:hypothetical protein